MRRDETREALHSCCKGGHQGERRDEKSKRAKERGKGEEGEEAEEGEEIVRKGIWGGARDKEKKEAA